MINYISLYAKDNLFDKKDHIAYWVDTAKKDWKAVNDLYIGKNYAQALFFGHLVLEKLLKAHWVKDNIDNTPPKTHNLIAILSKTQYEMAEADADAKFLSEMNQFQLEGRYPDYVNNIYKIFKSKQTKPILEQVNIIRNAYSKICNKAY